MKKNIKLLVLSSFVSLAFSAHAAISQGQHFGDWEGVCQNGQCGVAQVEKNADNVPVSRVIIQKMKEAGNNPVMIITVPLGVNLKEGMGLAIDSKQLARVPFDFCDQGGCNVALPLEGEALTKIKSGNNMQVAAFVGAEQQTVQFSLKGVTAAISAL